jgi:hypothetical protein
MRYEMRLLENGWAVWDTQVNLPATVEDCWQTSLGMDDADDLTDLLNRLDRDQNPEPFPPPEEDLGGGDICSLESTPSTEDDRPLD